MEIKDIKDIIDMAEDKKDRHLIMMAYFQGRLDMLDTYAKAEEEPYHGD